MFGKVGKGASRPRVSFASTRRKLRASSSQRELSNPASGERATRTPTRLGGKVHGKDVNAANEAVFLCARYETRLARFFHGWWLRPSFV